MDHFLGLTIVLFIVLAAFLGTAVRATKYQVKYKGTEHDKVAFSAIRPKSGDMVLFVSYLHGFTNSLIAQSYYSHVGIVVEDESGGLFLSEALAGGSRLASFEDKVQQYNGGIFYAPLKHGLAAEKKALLWELAQKTTPYPNLKHALGGLVGLPMSGRARHCMQHVAWLVDEIGLTPLECLERGKTVLSAGFYGTPHAVTTIPGKALRDGNSYASPREVVFDSILNPSRGGV